MNETTTVRHAWCFSHGTMHFFRGEPWCTADWTYLAGFDQDAAMADKQERFGDAEFLHHLPDDTQLAILREHRDRRA